MSGTLSDEALRALWRAPDGFAVKRDGMRLHMRTVADMHTAIKRHLHLVAREEIDLVVGLPRSGLVPAALVALHLNLPVVALSDLAAGNLAQRNTNRWSPAHHRLSRALDSGGTVTVLVVDDTVNTGGAIRRFRAEHAELLAQPHLRFRFLAIYNSIHNPPDPDLTFETVPGPRIFEWNLMHHSMSETYLSDLDGVLCPDGPPENSNDGGLYEDYIRNAPLKLRPTFKLGAIVTSRIEKWRAATTEWLAKHDIRHDALVMLDVPSAEHRRQLQVYGRYKADVYNALGGNLFVESDSGQAHQIAQLTGRPVFCTDTGVFLPERK